MPIPIALALAAAPSLIKGIGGLFQIGGAKKVTRPDYNIPQEFQDNVAMAENMARVGLPQQQYNNQLNLIGRNQAGGLATLGRSANPSAGIASLVRAGNDATMNLNSADATTRLNNQRFAFGQRGVLGQQKLAQQQWNKFGKYNEEANASAALKGAGYQNVFGALNDASQLGLMNLANENSSGTDSGTSNTKSTPVSLPTLGMAPTNNSGYQWNPYGSQFNNPFLRR